MGETFIGKFRMQEMPKQDWRSTTLVFRKPSGEAQVKLSI